MRETDLTDPVYFQVGFLNITPHKKQMAILRSKAKYKIVCAGRRGGKSKMIAGEIFRGASLKLYLGQVVISPTYKQTKIVFEEIIKQARDNHLLQDINSYVESPHPKIIFCNGCYVDFFSADNPKSIRGFEYDRVFIDEAAFIKQDAWKAIRPLTFDVGAPMWLISTPLGKDMFYEEYQKGLKGEGDYESFHFTSLNNPYISKETVLKEIEEYGENSVYVQTEILANFVEDYDALFPVQLVQSCIDENLMFCEV